MLPTPLKRSTSLYDNIPNLDSWYAQKHDESNQVVPCRKKRSSPLATVSFSTEPPAVYHYETKERPVHRRSSSSDHVKELLKHYTSKLSRQLSHRSSTQRS
ncbi:hypothetical protein HPULCUR_004607 [Helicostylum pulchrum]|uniref:Uncharacterized protein n=1 Tax=Helicostylum pulchrum TaxID=562976 RepID=A0ABP9XWP9_9FUNG